MQAGLKRVAIAAAFVVGAALLFALPGDAADAHESFRDWKCRGRADRYAEDDHPTVDPDELADRIAWLYSQCDENDAVEAFAEEQGSMAEPLFPNTAEDRHAHPLHCMALNDYRFGMHTQHNSANPPEDPEGPGGAAAINITGEFMYAWIDGKARFFSRYVVWTIDDRDGNVLSPVRIMQHPTYMGTPQTHVATLGFGQAYKPNSVWVEMPDTMATANNESSGILPGRRLTVRTWMESHCHDKRDPTVIPQMLIDHMTGLGWLNPNSRPREPQVVRFVANGDPNDPASWALQEIPVSYPSVIKARGQYRFFYNNKITVGQPDEVNPSKPQNFAATPIAARKVRLTWNASSDNVEVAGYYIYKDGQRVGFTENTQFTFKSLWPETEYEFRVRAVDVSGNKSAFTPLLAATTLPDIYKPTKPKNVTATTTKTTITLNWEPATDNVAVSHYVIRLDGALVDDDVTDLSYVISGLERNTEYHVAIRAWDIYGNISQPVHLYPTTDP